MRRSHHRQRRTFVPCILASLFSTTVGLNAAVAVAEAPPQEQTYSIGVIGPMTGTTDYAGKMQLEGIRALVDERNHDRDRKFFLQLELRDDESSADRAVLLAQELAERDDIVAIVGAVNSSCTLQVAEESSRIKVPTVSAISTASVITNTVHPYFFRISVSDAFQMRRTAEYLVRRRKIQKFVLAFEAEDPTGQTDALGTGQINDFVSALRELGIPEANVEKWPFKRGAARGIAQQVAESARVGGYDGIGLFALNSDSLAIAAAIHDAGLRPLMFGGTAIAGRAFAEEGGSIVEGTVVLSPFYANDSRWSVMDFVERYQNATSRRPDTYSAQAYDAGAIIVDALHAAISVQRSKNSLLDAKSLRDPLREQLENAVLDGVTGTIEFNARHDSDRSLHVLAIRNGGLVPAASPQPDDHIASIDAIALAGVVGALVFAGGVFAGRGRWR